MPVYKAWTVRPTQLKIESNFDAFDKKNPSWFAGAKY